MSTSFTYGYIRLHVPLSWVQKNVNSGEMLFKLMCQFLRSWEAYGRIWMRQRMRSCLHHPHMATCPVIVHVYIWLHMSTHGYIWVHMGAYGCIWWGMGCPHMVTYGCIWVHMDALMSTSFTHGYIWVHMAAYGKQMDAYDCIRCVHGCIWLHMMIMDAKNVNGAITRVKSLCQFFSIPLSLLYPLCHSSLRPLRRL